ncbi:MAG: hypothetical protein R2819_16010 [Allomuricauda sp.]
MHIKIDIAREGEAPSTIKFGVSAKAIQETIRECFVGIGTPYEPIRIDNFVDLRGFEFPVIQGSTLITISLESETKPKKKPQLLCCRVINVGRDFNEKGDFPENHWEAIFKGNESNIFGAPDGTLFISTNKKNKCKISTLKKVPDVFVAYSIIFSLDIKLRKGYKRRYYFILDPVVRISSNT